MAAAARVAGSATGKLVGLVSKAREDLSMMLTSASTTQSGQEVAKVSLGLMKL